MEQSVGWDKAKSNKKKKSLQKSKHRKIIAKIFEYIIFFSEI